MQPNPKQSGDDDGVEKKPTENRIWSVDMDTVCECAARKVSDLMKVEKKTRSSHWKSRIGDKKKWQTALYSMYICTHTAVLRWSVRLYAPNRLEFDPITIRIKI